MSLGRITAGEGHQMRLLLPAEQTRCTRTGPLPQRRLHPFLHAPLARALHRRHSHMQGAGDLRIIGPLIRLQQNVRPRQLPRGCPAFGGQRVQRRALLLAQVDDVFLGPAGPQLCEHQQSAGLLSPQVLDGGVVGYKLSIDRLPSTSIMLSA